MRRSLLVASLFAIGTSTIACGDSGSGGSGGSGGSTTSATTGSMGTTTSSSTGGSNPEPCPGTGAEITDLPACAGNTASPVGVVLGCEPTVDGTLHADEWADGTCFTAGDMTMVAKFAGDALYLAASGQPSCGCPMGFYFNPDGTPTASGDEYALGLFDDPFMKDGDRFDNVLMNGMFTMGTAPAGIVTACPGNQPSPVRYEIKLPYSAIGVTAGSAHDLGFAFVHSSAKWPATLTVDPMGGPNDPSSWGKLSSNTWK